MKLKLYEHWYSKYEDEDFYDDLERKKREVKYYPQGTAATFGLVGGGAGHALGQAFTRHGGKDFAKRARKNRWVGAAIGAAGLGYLGYRRGKRIKNETEREVSKLRRRYKSGNEADKKYLRARFKDYEKRKLDERKTRAQEQIAWNTMWN